MLIERCPVGSGVLQDVYWNSIYFDGKWQRDEYGAFACAVHWCECCGGASVYVFMALMCVCVSVSADCGLALI